MFHVSHLKHGLLRLPNGKSVKNINDYKLEMVKLKLNPTRRVEIPKERAVDSSQPSLKSILHLHHDEPPTICQDVDIPINGYQSTSIFQNKCSDRKQNLLNLYHTHHSVITSSDTSYDTVFSPVESIQGSCTSYSVSKCCFKFGNLQFVLLF